MVLALSGWWLVGWVLALVVVLLAASLLLLAIFTANRIANQAGDILSALDGTRRNTSPLFDLAKTNLALDRIGRGLGAGS